MAALLYLWLSLLLVLTPASATPRCCMYSQWEGTLFFGFASSGEDFIFSNGTARVSYDLVNAKTFVNFEIYKWSPPSLLSRTSAVVISHFKTGVKYEISIENRTCEKGSLTTTNMTTYCASDFHESKGHPRGRIGGSMSVTNIDILEEIIYSTIYQDASNCMPLFALEKLKAPGLTIAAGVDFLDQEEGIKDPTVFTPPSYCPETLSGKKDDASFLGFSSLFHKKQQ